MKKVFALLLAMALCACLFACGEDEAAPTTLNEPSTSSVTDSAETNPTTPTEPSHTHDWQAATCTAPKTCKTCNATSGSTTPHNWKAATCQAPKTCTTCGKTEGSAASHDWKSATCTAPKTCKTCGKTEGSVGDHNWKAATCQTPKTCKTCGKTEGSVDDHNWKAATCTEPKTCKNCKATEGSANGHSWKSATCTAPKTCKTCGKTEGSAKGHSYSSGKCTGCGAKDPNYQDPRCYTGTSILTITEVTGAKCTGSWTNNLDLNPVANSYVAGCQRYEYKYEKPYTPYAIDEYNQYFTPYIEYLTGLGLKCTYASQPVGGFMDELYAFKTSNNLTITVSWNISSYFNYSWICISVY